MKLEAYERLEAAKIYPGESFSEVVMRASWPERTATAEELIMTCRKQGPTFSPFSLDELDRIDELKERDEPPEDKWAKR